MIFRNHDRITNISCPKKLDNVIDITITDISLTYHEQTPRSEGERKTWQCTRCIPERSEASRVIRATLACAVLLTYSGSEAMEFHLGFPGLCACRWPVQTHLVSQSGLLCRCVDHLPVPLLHAALQRQIHDDASRCQPLLEIYV